MKNWSTTPLTPSLTLSFKLLYHKLSNTTGQPPSTLPSQKFAASKTSFMTAALKARNLHLHLSPLTFIITHLIFQYNLMALLSHPCYKLLTANITPSTVHITSSTNFSLFYLSIFMKKVSGRAYSFPMC